MSYQETKQLEAIKELLQGLKEVQKREIVYSKNNEDDEQQNDMMRGDIRTRKAFIESLERILGRFGWHLHESDS